MHQSDLPTCKHCGGTEFTELSEHEDHGSFFFGPAIGPRFVIVLQCKCGEKLAKVVNRSNRERSE